MSAHDTVYRLAVGAARAAAPLLGSGQSKFARGIAGRRDAARVLADWGTNARDPDRPTVWFHAPSVGEGLQARAVIEALRERRADVQIVFTYFSPSATELAARMPVEVTGYLPWDLGAPCARVLDALRPDALVFTKTEIWPVLAAAASARGIPLAMIGGTVPPGAGRMRWPARAFLRDAWRSLALAGVLTAEDGARFAALGVDGGAIRVTGDPGIDAALARLARVDPSAPYIALFAEAAGPWLVAGSTWPADEAVLVPALATLRADGSPLRSVFAPHEPSAGSVDALRARLGRAGLSTQTLSVAESAGRLEADAVVVDRVGVLAHLYTMADVAYVGGGFHTAGLHSVVEPAAARVPVLFGPRHRNARAATELVEAGGARVVSHAEEVRFALGTWIENRTARDYAATRAFGYIDAHRGAASRSAALLVSLLNA
jgi:3-deoxy-D-manno-octulosonic-acid transferase